MLSSILLTFRSADCSAAVPEKSGKYLQGMVYEWLSQSSPDLSRRIHEDRGDVPFTVSLLTPMRRQDEQGEERLFRARITTLSDECLAAFLDSAHRTYLGEGAVKLGPLDLTVADVRVSGSAGRATVTSFEDLLHESDARAFEFEFRTPTAFKSGKVSVPLPVPRLMFQSYLRKWNAFAPEGLVINPAVTDEIDRAVMITRHRIQTALADIAPIRMVGFVGRCALEISPEGISEDGLRAFSALSRFAFFAGTGAKASVGMGQTIPRPL